MSMKLLNLRDGGTDYMGKGVKKAVANVNSIISSKVVGLSVFNQKRNRSIND